MGVPWECVGFQARVTQAGFLGGAAFSPWLQRPLIQARGSGPPCIYSGVEGLGQ